MRLRIICFCSLFIFSGCAIFLPSPSKIQSRHGIQLRGPITEKQSKRLDEFLDVFKKVPAVIKSVKSISVSDYEINYTANNSAGVCYITQDICIKSDYINDPGTIWHEVGHAYHYQLNSSESDFSKKWKKIAGDVYGKDYADQAFFQYGILSKHGSKDYMEDVAVWVENFYSSIHLRYSVFWRVDFKSLDKKIKTIYIEKLFLLKEYGFISADDYKVFLIVQGNDFRK